MKNKPSIQSARNRTKVGIKSVVNATKVLSPILLFAFLTLGFGQAWGDQMWCNVYFDNSTKQWSNVSLLLGGNNYSSAYRFTKLNNCNLWYRWIDYDNFNDAYFINADWGDVSTNNSQKPWDRVSSMSASDRWQPYKTNYNDNAKSGTAVRYYFDGVNNSSKAGGLPLYTATLKVKKSTDGGAYTEITSGSWPATINLKGTHMASNAATGQNNFNTSSGASATYDNVPVSGEVTMTLGIISDSKYEFVGWGTGSEATTTTTPYMYNITGATTYYAFFRTKEYTIAYNGGTNAESGSHANDTKYHGTNITLPGAVFHRTGYAQTGWAKSDGGSKEYELGATYTANSAATLYPVWTAEETHDITVEYKCGTGTIKTAATESAVGVTTTRSITAPTITGFTFSGWTIGDGVKNNSGSTTANPISVNSKTSGSYTLTANYTCDWKLRGSMDGWGSGYSMTATSSTSVYTEVTLDANKDYSFKFKNGETWYGASTVTDIKYTNRATAQSMNATPGNNQTITTAGAGTYRFTWDITNKKVTITYPTSYTVTFDVGTIKGNSRTITAYEYGHQGDAAYKVNSGDYVTTGTQVQFYAGANTPAEVAASGYGWKGFYGNAVGSDPQLAYTTAYSPYITTNTTVYACFYELDYYITPYIVGQGTVSPAEGQNGHIATPVSFTATPGTGYKFDGWTERGGSSLTIASPSATTTNVTTTAVATLQANFSQQWSVMVKKDGGEWCATNANLLTGYGEGTIGYADITLDANSNYEIKIYDRQASTWYGGSVAQNIDYEHSGLETVYTIATTSTPYSVYLQSAAAGTYRFAWNLTGYKIAVQYPTSWFITSGQKTEGQDDEAGGSFTAVDDSSNDVKGGKFVADNASVTFTATPNTGYTFDGWYSNAACTTPYTAGTNVSFSGEGNTTMVISSIDANQTIYAKFTPKTYTINLTQTGAKTEGSTSVTATYNAVLPDITLPVANDGYAFMGYYSAEDGEGTIFMDGLGNWAGNNFPYTDAGKKWIYDGGITLYAYYKQAKITALTLSSGVVESGATVIATPVIDPSPAGNTKLCWKILRSNGNLLTDEGFTPLSGNAVRFNAPTAGGTYKVACVLRTGLSCSGGTVLDSVVTDLVVASAHTVTIRYQDSEGRSLAAPVEMTGLPLKWSTAINPPSITGYNFTRWEAGDGIFISTDGSTKIEEGTTTTPTIYMKSQYDGTLTAVYSKKRMIYFNNTLGWSNVYVYFYKNNSYWDNSGKDWGTGANTGYTYTDTPYSEGKHGKMIQIPGTNIYYFDAESAGVNASYKDIVFTEADQHNYGYFSDTKVVRRGDYKSSLPMFVPLAGQTPATHNTSAKYYDEGYWMNYPENTGYTLHIYRGTAKGVLDEIRSIAFPFTADKTMPMEVTLELNANTTYGYEIHRADGNYYGYNTSVLKINASGDEGKNETPIKLVQNNRGGIKTSAAGDYTFKLNFGESSGYGYLFGVHYPASVGSYRLVYKDLAEWSQGSSHTDSWSHPSRVIYKNEGAADTVSFFVAKGHTPTIQIQKITSIDNEGNITWENVGSATSYDTVSAAGVYNFITSQTAPALTIAKVEPYTGNYYIRTGAVDGKWDNYRTGADHLMTYSAFSEDRAQNTFGELFSHYKAKWCPRGTNVVFCIANDYSSCISDTLVQDVGNPYNNIYPANDPNRPGELKAESYDGTTISSSETGDKYSANIRFMWNRSTNKISRAYVSSSTNTAKKFLVLKGENTFWNSDGSDLSGSGESHANKEAIFQDNENWIYEREIKVTTRTKFKLFACYAQDSPSEANAQYFRGNYAEGAWTEGNYVILINGDGTGTCNARLIYDFKTNRLIAAYLPDGSAVSGETAIHADLMVIREHQGAGQQITFNTGGSLTEVKTVYGVMRFNRWILNNRQHPEDHLKEHCETDEAIRTHHPLVDAGSMKSSDERGLYWISFPFDVNLSEVFGFGTYGVHWIIMRYNGAARAAQGYWADSEGFWEYIEDRNGVVLKGGMGYVLALDLDLMQATDRTFWSHDIQQIELFFPSTSIAGTIKQTTATVEVPAHTCTIDRTNSGGTSPDINKNRTKVDSHWNIIGVPSFANYGTTLTDEDGTVTWKDNSALDWTNDLPFLYEWNANDNTYTVQSGSSYPFKAMHAYYVQYHGTLTWSLASATTPSPIVARRTYAEEPQSEEFRLELRRNDKMEDQTFVKMSNDENASANFVFGEDLTKEKNTKKANIYTLVEGYIPVAGNTLPMSNQTTIVPVGVSIKSTGDYTFSIPEGTDGVGVVLVDEATGVRTSLSALDYTVTLQQGDYTNRFYLEISPIQNTPTGLEEPTSNFSLKGRAQKRIIDGVLYIVKDGKIFDARGARVE